MIVDTGNKTISVQKSGCNHTRTNTTHIIHKKGRNPFLKSLKYCLFFLKKVARYIISASFKNSVGWIVKGIQGILSHPVAHL